MSLRIALVYDRLYPQNIGGLERYYDALARGLADSNSVTYITREVEEEDPPGFRPYRVIPVAPNSPFYSARGNRRIWPTLRFGFGVFVHLLRHGRDYDVVQSASFPFFSVIAARLAFALRRPRHRPTPEIASRTAPPPSPPRPPTSSSPVGTSPRSRPR